MLHSEDAQVSTDRLLSVAVEASAAAGKVLLNYTRSGFHIQRKNHHINLVTDADHAAEECIIDHIRRHFPSHRTLAEEQEPEWTHHRVTAGSSIRWTAPRILRTDFRLCRFDRGRMRWRIARRRGV
jgi:3'-phosphoadenosine 5'-phosphosulfate (PAPS) 3'-phosphatase